MSEILNQMWRAEARPHVGRPVKISLRDVQGAVAGMLVHIAPNSLVLEVEGRQETIAFNRISAIEPRPAAPSNP